MEKSGSAYIHTYIQNIRCSYSTADRHLHQYQDLWKCYRIYTANTSVHTSIKCSKTLHFNIFHTHACCRSFYLKEIFSSPEIFYIFSISCKAGKYFFFNTHSHRPLFTEAQIFWQPNKTEQDISTSDAKTFMKYESIFLQHSIW